MRKIIIDLEKPMRDAVAEELEKYCRDVIKKYSNYGQEWAFGAVDFARSIRLIDVAQHSHLMNEFNDFKKEEDPSGGNRMGSKK